MYREMRRKDRAMEQEAAWELLRGAEYGILSTVGEDGQPYATPLSYVVIGETIYFHCAMKGHKLDNIAHESRVCFCVVGDTLPLLDGGLTTLYESVVAFGTCEPVADLERKADILMRLSEKYLPQHMAEAREEISGAVKHTGVYGIQVRRLTGKRRKKSGPAEQA